MRNKHICFTRQRNLVSYSEGKTKLQLYAYKFLRL